MPHAALRPCAQPGCPSLIRGQTRCPDHQRKVARQYDRQRGTASERGYDARWRKVRRRQLKREPLCKLCEEEGRTTAATLVDHIEPLSMGGARLDPDNLQSLCHGCHNRKTARDGSRGVGETSPPDAAETGGWSQIHGGTSRSEVR